jgi:ApaG protein
MSTRQLYYRITRGIRITARPRYLPDQSDPDEPRFVFAYRIRIENVSGAPAQLPAATGTSTIR